MKKVVLSKPIHEAGMAVLDGKAEIVVLADSSPAAVMPCNSAEGKGRDAGYSSITVLAKLSGPHAWA